MDFLLFCFDRRGRKYYHARFMSARAVIDSVEFARAGEHFSDSVPVGELARLADCLYDAVGEIRFDLAGNSDSKQRLRLQLAVAGNINLKCQRCLGSLAFPVSVQSNLLVLTAQAGGETANIDDLDGVPASTQTDVWSLVEDEILLAIPFAPRHVQEQCGAAAIATENKVASPFAVLAKIAQERIKN
jgi:uncharacterized protein